MLAAPCEARPHPQKAQKTALESVPSGTDPRIERYQGIARDEKNRVVYREEHEVEYRNDRVRQARSRYFSPEGKLLAELDSEFPGGVSLPKYRFRNLAANYEEGVECCAGGRLEVFHRGSRRTLEFQPNWVSGQGFHYLTREHLTSIRAGEKQEFVFLIPSKLAVYDFRIRSGGSDPANPRQERVLLEIDQWFFRLFAPKIVATYDLETRRLMRYEGPSNIEDAQGNIPTVRIDYDYSASAASPRIPPSGKE